MKLHVGCGQNYLDGYINLEFAKVFLSPPHKVDMLGSGMTLPFKNGSLDEIISYHVIEHMPRPASPEAKEKYHYNVEDFLDECVRTLKTGGKLTAECPDFEKIINELVIENKQDRIDNIFGLDRYEGDIHHWGYTAQSLKELFKSRGLTVTKVTGGTDYHTKFEPTLRIEALKMGLKYINIEPTSACNLKCVTCTRDIIKRPDSFMDFALFEDIIRQLTELELFDIEIRFFLSGEPLAAGKDLIKMVAYAHEKGFKNTLIHTNATLLNRHGLELLQAGLGTISLSIDGAEKTVYENARAGAKFDKVIPAAVQFLEAAKNFNTKTIIQTIIPHGEDTVQTEIKMKNLLPGADEYYVRYPHNWNTLDSITGENLTGGVTYRCFPDYMMSIYADGRVPVCCADLNGDYILADIKKESLVDIWVEKLGSIRDRMSRGESIPELCDNCERYCNTAAYTKKQKERELQGALTMNKRYEINPLQTETERSLFFYKLSKIDDLLEKEDVAEAELQLKQLQEEYGDNTYILNDFAVIAILKKDYAKALEYIEKVLAINQADEIAIENLQYLSRVTSTDQGNEKPAERKPLVLPPGYQNAIGGGDYYEVGAEFLKYFVELAKIKPSDSILDVGCGYGRMAMALACYLNSLGRYEGFDIIPAEIEWCRNNITREYPNFKFQTADIYNKHYNPNGKYEAGFYDFPFISGSFDFVFLTSVFTHMTTYDVDNYLKEIFRVLKPGGKCLATFFLADGSMISRGSIPNGFNYRIGEMYLRNINDPEAAICYNEAFIRKLYTKNGLTIKEPIHYGNWSGREIFLSYQDIIISEK